MVESSSSKREFFCYKNLTFRWWSCSVASTARSQGVAWFSSALGSGVGGFCFPQTSGDPTWGWWSLMKPTYMKYKTRYPTGGLESPIILNDNIYNKYTEYYMSLDLFFFRSFRMKNLLDDVGHLDEGPKYGFSWMGWSQEEIFNGWLEEFSGMFEDFWWLKDRYQRNGLYMIIHI